MPPEQSISAADGMDVINLAGETSLQGNLAASALSAYNNQVASGSGNINSGTGYFVGNIDTVGSDNSHGSSTSSYRYQELNRTRDDIKSDNYRYQTVNPQGKPAEEGGLYNRETLISSHSDLNVPVQTNTFHKYNPVPLTKKGILTDHVSAPHVPHNASGHLSQRFSNELIKYPGYRWGNMSTVFQHDYWFVNGEVTRIEARIVVP